MDQKYRKVRRTAIITAMICVAVVIVIFIAPILLILNSSIRPIVRKQKIFNLVEKNYDIIAEACESNDSAALSSIDGIRDVDFVNGYVLVYCKDTDLLPKPSVTDFIIPGIIFRLLYQMRKFYVIVPNL